MKREMVLGFRGLAFGLMLVFALFLSQESWARNIARSGACASGLSSLGGVFKIGFPFPMTPSIEAVPLGVDEFEWRGRSYQTQKVYFNSQQLIPSRTWVESWHSILVKFDGSYQLLQFEDENQAVNFMKEHPLSPLITPGFENGRWVVILRDDVYQRAVRNRSAEIPSYHFGGHSMGRYGVVTTRRGTTYVFSGSTVSVTTRSGRKSVVAQPRVS